MPLGTLTIPLGGDLADRLAKLAQRERRDPRQQAVLIIEQALHQHEQAGAGAEPSPAASTGGGHDRR
jgi:predicted transcriptional regulator